MRIILTSLKGEAVEYALNFAFLASNNEAEYEAPLISLKLELKVQKLQVFSDFQLIVGQL